MAQCTSQRNLYTIKTSSTSVFECNLCDKALLRRAASQDTFLQVIRTKKTTLSPRVQHHFGVMKHRVIVGKRKINLCILYFVLNRMI